MGAKPTRQHVASNTPNLYLILLTRFTLCVDCVGLAPVQHPWVLRCRDVQPLGEQNHAKPLRYPTGFGMVFSLSERSLTRHGSSPTGSPLEEAPCGRKETAWVPVFYPPLTKG